MRKAAIVGFVAGLITVGAVVGLEALLTRAPERSWSEAIMAVATVVLVLATSAYVVLTYEQAVSQRGQVEEARAARYAPAIGRLMEVRFQVIDPIAVDAMGLFPIDQWPPDLAHIRDLSTIGERAEKAHSEVGPVLATLPAPVLAKALAAYKALLHLARHSLVISQSILQATIKNLDVEDFDADQLGQVRPGDRSTVHDLVAQAQSVIANADGDPFASLSWEDVEGAYYTRVRENLQGTEWSELVHGAALKGLEEALSELDVAAQQAVP